MDEDRLLTIQVCHAAAIKGAVVLLIIILESELLSYRRDMGIRIISIIIYHCPVFVDILHMYHYCRIL